MRPRRSTTPRLEAIEDRVVPSAVSLNLSPADRAHVRSFNRTVMHAADKVQDTVAGLFHQQHAARPTRSAFGKPAPHKAETLFGIPFIKI
ncbi:hypothetical protein OJF2_06180 [Aquisphaera giovannonii]|uniref:Uncharacterized protein n=1 Tax=Aquisphaera giovannonii TaxID=406548 RepID=A0A5B9VVH2_9BACT|nr:hypothetical protein [Aquisphaera giovannonii]QEH32149.1 hypothetical protein OJF2_06180 [Aquisphaera giovannonii]